MLVSRDHSRSNARRDRRTASAYIRGSANRQEFLERALDWVSKGDIGSYMSQHRNDNNINELKTYFNSVMDWVSTLFIDVLPEMRGLEWGRLYELYHGKSYDPKKMSDDVKRLAADDCVTSRKGIFEFLLGGSVDTKLLEGVDASQIDDHSCHPFLWRPGRRV